MGERFCLSNPFQKRELSLQRLLRSQRNSRSLLSWSHDPSSGGLLGNVQRYLPMDLRLIASDLKTHAYAHDRTSIPTFTTSLGCFTRFQAMSVMCSKPSTPPKSTNAP